ncbi:MAG: hypothetical protein ACE5OR_13260 [bacterium]
MNNSKEEEKRFKTPEDLLRSEGKYWSATLLGAIIRLDGIIESEILGTSYVPHGIPKVRLTEEMNPDLCRKEMDLYEWTIGESVGGFFRVFWESVIKRKKYIMDAVVTMDNNLNVRVKLNKESFREHAENIRKNYGKDKAVIVLQDPPERYEEPTCER